MTVMSGARTVVIASASEAIHADAEWIASSLTLPGANASRMSPAMTTYDEAENCRSINAVINRGIAGVRSEIPRTRWMAASSG